MDSAEFKCDKERTVRMPCPSWEASMDKGECSVRVRRVNKLLFLVIIRKEMK